MSADQQIDTSGCTEVTPECPVSATVYGDYFTTGACIFFVVSYASLMLAQLYLGWRSRTWSFSGYLFVGSVFELIGYIGRLQMSYNPFVNLAFILQVIFLILGPTLIAAAISVTFKHLVLYYGSKHSVIRPKLYPWVFVGSDFVSIIIQGAGGAIAASGTLGDNPDPDMVNLGNNLLIAGVSFQVVNMVVCGGLMLIYIYRFRKARSPSVRVSSSETLAPADAQTPAAMYGYRSPAQDTQAKRFIYAITMAYVAIIIRCSYRIPEMAAGWGSEIMQNETTFLIFDGAMILLATLLLTVVHPHFFFQFLSIKPAGFGDKGRASDSQDEQHTIEMEVHGSQA